MGTFSTLTVTYQDSAFNTGNNGISLVSLTSGYTLTGIDIIGAINFETYTGVVTGDNFISYVCAGIQHGNHGYTPVGTIGNADAANWLLWRHVEPTASIAFIANGTTAMIQDRYPFRMRWRGQLPVGATEQDYYFSNGSQLGSSVTPWKVTMAARVYYS